MKPIVSKNSRIRLPRHFSIGNYSIVDDFCYFSTKIEIGRCCHIASGCLVGGGKDYLFRLGDFSSVSAGVKIWCQSNDYVNDAIIIVPAHINVDSCALKGDVIIGEMCGIGSNAVIMPDNVIPEGVAIGAISYVPPRFKFKPWYVYAGIPIKPILPRNKKNVIKQIEKIKRALR